MTTEAGAPTSGQRWLLAVDGIDGSGKTVLGQRLVAALGEAGRPAALLRVDDFRRPVDWRAAGRLESDVYYEDYYDLARLNDAIEAFLAGGSGVTIPVFDSASERITGERRITFEGTTALLVEGVFVQRSPAVRDRGGIVYLRTSFDEARRRILARDTARGRTLADVSHRISARYFPAQERYLREHQPVVRADVLVEHERLGAPTTARLDLTRFAPGVEVILRRALEAFAAPPTAE